MYKPNFCSQCGVKLLRLRWRVWTSRRFCDECARRLRKERFVPLLCALVALTTAGYIAGRSRRLPPPPLIIQRRSDSPLTSSEDPVKPQASKNAPATVAEEEIYLCGARTKKGTPCSRRVHGPVRCWQHKGMPALLPQEKLAVKG